MSNRRWAKGAKETLRQMVAGEWTCPECGHKPFSFTNDEGEREWVSVHAGDCSVADEIEANL